jgi:hypothetical protein
MAMMYPETSPTAPVSREDLAAILAMQGMNAGDAAQAGFGPGQGSQSMSDMLGGMPGFQGRGDFNGAPPANSNPDDNAAVNQGDMVTANASMVAETGAVPASVFGREGDNNSQASKDARDAIAETMATNALNTMSMSDRNVTAPGWGTGYQPDFSVATPNAGAIVTGPGIPGFSGSPFSGRGGPDREGFGSIVDYAPNSNVDDFGNPISPDTDRSITAPGWATGPLPEGPGAPGWDTGDTGNHAIADMLADALADPGWGGGVVAPGGGGGARSGGGGGGARSGGAATTGGFNEGAANQGIADMMGAALADPGWGGGANAPGSGGYGPDFAGTGGYSGSGDVGNTSGAGGAVGGFGGGVGGGDGGGVGGGGVGGGGGGGGPGSGADPGGGVG